MKHSKNLLFILLILMAGCSLNNELPLNKKSHGNYHSLSAEDKKVADTLLLRILDNEGLFTVISGLKPISSVANPSFKIGRKDTLDAGKRNITDTASRDYKKLVQYRRIVDVLQFGDLKLVMTPFKMAEKGQRIMQINVYRQQLVDSLLSANTQFYGQFGFVPGTDGQLLINTTEYENKYDRFRSYGYLFGYPEHAVTFFAEASISNDRDGKFVKRDFYHIPVYSAAQGHFVYALPKDTQPGKTDALIHDRAAFALDYYKKIRPTYTRKDGTVRAYDLLQKLITGSDKK
ncbi:hypothetical protein ACSBL2_12195 [Pedobacter sp. AW31-3R]|uniref:hypothetical protein n=1 Tax=Pedobacter sp. AW31-3R TaxID=3445781 RepID=UPI003FA029C7